MTREQVETEMAQYRTIFTVVRLLDAAQVGGEESVNSFCSCYSYWGKNTPCRNCISRQVLEDHRQRTKLEYMGSEVFQVTAVYREVDGAPCVMELVQKLDGETLTPDADGKYTIPGAKITGTALTVTVEKTAKQTAEVNVYEYIKLDGKAIYLVTASGTVADGKVMAYDGSAMFWSDKYQAYAYLVISNTELTKAEAAKKVSQLPPRRPRSPMTATST